MRNKRWRRPLDDELDRQILSYLADTPRMPVAELARLIESKPETVGVRLRHLRKHGIVTFTAMPTAAHRGLPNSAFALVAVQPGTVEQVIAALAGLPETRFVAETAGRSAVLVELIYRDAAHLSDVLHKTIGKTEGIAHVETLLSLSIVKDETGRAR